jgi:hypothetical protein
MGYYAQGDTVSDIWGGLKTAASFVPVLGEPIQKGMGVLESAWGGIKGLFGGSPQPMSDAAFGNALSWSQSTLDTLLKSHPMITATAPQPDGGAFTSMAPPQRVPRLRRRRFRARRGAASPPVEMTSIMTAENPTPTSYRSADPLPTPPSSAGPFRVAWGALGGYATPQPGTEKMFTYKQIPVVPPTEPAAPPVPQAGEGSLLTLGARLRAMLP